VTIVVVVLEEKDNGHIWDKNIKYWLPEKKLNCIVILNTYMYVGTLQYVPRYMYSSS
jgi:hypothetical protein